MKVNIVINSYRLLFFIWGIFGLREIIKNLLLRNVSWSMLSYSSMFILCLISLASLYLSLELKNLLPKKQFLVNSVILIIGLNALSSIYLGRLGMNQAVIYKNMSDGQAIISGSIAAVFYLGLIIGLSFVSKKKIRFLNK